MASEDQEQSAQTLGGVLGLDHVKSTLGEEGQAYNRMRDAAVAHSHQYALLTLRTLMVAHGGAIVALLSLIGSFAHEPTLLPIAKSLAGALLIFVGGLAGC